MFSRYLRRPRQQTVVDDWSVPHPSASMPPRLAFERLTRLRKCRDLVQLAFCSELQRDGSRGGAGVETQSGTAHQLKLERRAKRFNIMNDVKKPRLSLSPCRGLEDVKRF